MVQIATVSGTYGPGEVIQGANISVSSGDCIRLVPGTNFNSNGFERIFTGPITDMSACGIRVLGPGCQITGTGATRNFPWGIADQGNGTYIFHHDIINSSYVGLHCGGANLVCRSVSVLGMTKTNPNSGYAIAFNVGAANCYFERVNARNIYKQIGGVGEGCGFLFSGIASNGRMDYCRVSNDVQDVSIGVWVAATGIKINDCDIINLERGIVGYGAALISRSAIIMPDSQLGSIGISLPNGSIGNPSWSVIGNYDTPITGGLIVGPGLDIY